MVKRLIMIVSLCLFGVATWAQSKNTATEVKDYREVDGKIIIGMVVNGVQADFVLDLAGHNAILPEYVEKFNIDPNQEGDFHYDSFLYKKVLLAQFLSGIMCSGIVWRHSCWKMNLICENSGLLELLAGRCSVTWY